MSTAFRASVVWARDTSHSIEEGDLCDGSMKIRQIKSAQFAIQSNGPCPWPPSNIVGSHVAVVDANELIPLLDQSVEVLNSHLESHQIDGEVKAHLARMTELIARLKPPKKPQSTENLV